MLTHFPVAFALFAPVAGGFALYLTRTGSVHARRAWIGVVIGQLFLIGAIYAALATGENDEEFLSAADPANHEIIHEHEERAELFFLSAIAVALLSLVGIKENAYTGIVRGATMLAQCGLLFLCFWTASSGGKLVHEKGLSRYLLEARQQNSTDPTGQETGSATGEAGASD